VIGCADSGQNPPAVRSGSSRVRGGSGRQDTVGAQCRLGSTEDDQDATRPDAGPVGGDASRAKAKPHGGRLARLDTVPRIQGWQPRKSGGGRGKLQIISLLCKPICKPDAARQRETGETEPTE
jgi:hypothetical protein